MKEQARNHVNRKLSESDGAPAKLTDAVSGEFVTDMFGYDGGRQVTVYVPPEPPEAIVFAGDGQRISKWGQLLEKADAPSTMIVGVHGLTDETLRLHEYSPGFEPERFAAHEKFFVEDVRRWTESQFGVALRSERIAVFGVSAGGELALAPGLRHPHVYGAVLCASPGGGYKPPGVMPRPLPRTYLENARRWVDALRDADADVVMNERVGSRGGAFWREEFPLMVAWHSGDDASRCLTGGSDTTTHLVRSSPGRRRLALNGRHKGTVSSADRSCRSGWFAIPSRVTLSFTTRRRFLPAHQALTLLQT